MDGSTNVRAIAGIAGGLLMLGNVIVSYTYMHVVFFGVPHFTLHTPMGLSEISYALSNLVLIGFGVLSLSSGLRARRKESS